MIHIGSISEHPEISRQVESVCGKYLRDEGKACAFYSYENSYVFQQDLERGKRDFDLLFLDTAMRGINAVDLADRINRRKDVPVMVFLSTAAQGYYEDAFRVGAVHFLQLPMKDKDLLIALKRALSVLEHRWHRKLLFKSTEGEAVVDLSTLEAVVSDDHHQVLCLSDGSTEEVRTKLTQLEKRLKDASPFFFITSCRGVLVNLEQVSEVLPDRVVTKTGRNLPISKRRYPDVRAAFIRYHGGDEEDLE